MRTNPEKQFPRIGNNRKRFIIALLMALAFSSCDSGPKIGGKSADYWVDRLEDADPDTCNNAFQKLVHSTPEQLKRHRKKLSELAKNRANNAGGGMASVILFSKFGDTEYCDIDYYIDFIGLSDAADKGILKAAIKDREKVLSMLRERAKMTPFDLDSAEEQANKLKNAQAAAKLILAIEAH